MAYTPPTGNAVPFVFVNGGYVPPGGGAVPFVFGGAPPAPSSYVGRIGRFAQYEDDDDPRRRRPGSAPVAAAVVYVAPYRLRRELEEDEPLRRRARYVTVFRDDETVVSLVF